MSDHAVNDSLVHDSYFCQSSSFLRGSITMPFPTQRVSGPNFTLPGVNVINILREAFVHTEPKSAKKIVKPSVFFAFWGSVGVKASSKCL
jgi:hypothetical protein